MIVRDGERQWDGGDGDVTEDTVIHLDGFGAFGEDEAFECVILRQTIDPSAGCSREDVDGTVHPHHVEDGQDEGLVGFHITGSGDRD